MSLEPDRAPKDTQRGVDLPGARAASRKVIYVGVLMFGTFVCSSIPLPWQMAGLVFAVAAVVVGATALRGLARAQVRGVLPVVLVMALVFSGLSALSYGSTLLFWSIHLERQECLRDAITVSASAQCEKDYRDALQAKLDQWMRSTRPSTASTG